MRAACPCVLLKIVSYVGLSLLQWLEFEKHFPLMDTKKRFSWPLQKKINLLLEVLLIYSQTKFDRVCYCGVFVKQLSNGKLYLKEKNIEC